MCSLVMAHWEPLLSDIVTLCYWTLFEKAGFNLDSLPFSMLVFKFIYFIDSYQY